VAALALVALLHAGMALLLMRAIIVPPRPPVLPPETIITLTRAPRSVRQPQAPAEARAPVAAPRPAAPPPLPNYAMIPPTPENAPMFAAPRNDLEALIHGCSARKSFTMTPEERERCGLAFKQPPRPDIPGSTPEKVKNEAIWAAERAANLKPARVPCVTAFSNAIPNSSVQEKGVMLDTLCAFEQLQKALARD
jgi:hypothetical protein